MCKLFLKSSGFLLLLFFVSLATIQARGKLQGYAIKGGKLIQTSPLTTNKVVESFPNCTITVYQAGTVTPATIYSNNSGSSKANPFTAASDGFFFFYVDNGRYDIQFSGTGIATPFTISDQLIYDETTDFASTSNLGQTLLDTAPLSSSSPIAVGTNSDLVINKLNCPNAAKYGAATSASASTNTTAIANAIAAGVLNGGGDVCLPAGRLDITGNILLPSGIRIIGADGTGITTNGSYRLRLMNSNASVFLIGEGVVDVGLKGVTLETNSGLTNTNGIKFIGAYPNASQTFSFKDITIKNFTRGHYVLATDVSKVWQASYITYTDSSFVGNDYAVWQEAVNSEVSFLNVKFYVPAAKYGLWLETTGKIHLINSYGLGNVATPLCSSFGSAPTYTPTYNTNLSHTFIHIQGLHAPITIDASPAEYFRHYLVNNAEDLNNPIIIKGTALFDVQLNADTTFISIGNSLYSNSIVTSNSITNDTRIFSYGDILRYNGALTHKCLGAAASGDGFLIGSSTTKIVEKTTRDGTNLALPTAIGDLASVSAASYSTLTEPLLSIGAFDTTPTKLLLRLGLTNSSGVANFSYNFSRDANTGFLNIAGSQGAPYTGLFNNGYLNLKTDFSLGIPTLPSNSGVLGYDQASGLWRATDGTGAVRTFSRISNVMAVNRLYRSLDITGLATFSLLEDNGTNLNLTSGNFTLTNGALTLTNGSLTLTSGNATLTSGSLSLVSGNATLSSGSLSLLSGRYYNSTIVTFTDTDTTPSVSGANTFKTANTGATSITMFDNGVTGQRITVICTEANTTIVDGGFLKLSADLVCTTDDIISLIFDGTNWYEESRSIN